MVMRGAVFREVHRHRVVRHMDLMQGIDQAGQLLELLGHRLPIAASRPRIS